MFEGINTQKVLLGFIGLIVLLTVVAGSITYVTDAGDQINATGLPFAGLFASDSILPLIIMAGLLIGVVAYVMGRK